ncbi:50S ribosomal protein L21, chloroplastic [Punica granatum]|uniref:Uncharacterized protein n=2 Tax=Punica granatum TaxID=22663 RepID=A0A218W0T5_PUNGR|nr:50S ribosomal protein L21, chloroplastic [Punica granatum]OWM65732.1 hypothetical protein CDL15_Pgr015156 [Punica granatum]PKI62424.1 hypothetical protein CRG98_017230 [Punica granatum]
MACCSTTSSALFLCSHLKLHCRVSPALHNPPLPSLSLSNSKKPILASPHSLWFSSKQKNPPLAPPRFSEAEAPVLEVQPEPEPAQIVSQAPKREEVFAVVMIGSRQYIVFPGRYIHTQRLKGANVNDKIILNKVLLVGTKTSTYIGKPVVPNTAVHAVVEEQGLDPKVIVFKYKKKKKYRRNIGHRQPNTRIRITGITGYQDSPAVTLNSL